MIVKAKMPRSCCLPRGRLPKPREVGVHRRTLELALQLREQADEIYLFIVLLRAIAMKRGEKMLSRRIGHAYHLAMAMRIDRRVEQLLSVDWELQQAAQMVARYQGETDEHISSSEGRHVDVPCLGNLPEGSCSCRGHDGRSEGQCVEGRRASRDRVDRHASAT